MFDHPNLIQEIKRGNVVLFLGSGASFGSVNRIGEGIPMVPKLKEMLSVEFLGGAEQDSDLATVAELSASESDLITTQIFVKKIFDDYEPADFHYKIPLFNWKSIYSTNYDLIIEGVYRHANDPSKKLVPIISSRDRVDALITSEADLPYVKLHGCIQHIGENDPPLILSVDQYVTHRQQRETLFERLKQLGTSYTILFVGHSLQDPDIRQVLHEIESITSSRPRYYALMKDFSDMHARLWEGKRVTLIKGTFSDFLSSLEGQISEVERAFSYAEKSHEIERTFVSNDYKLTPETLSILDSQLLFIHIGMATEVSKPALFYKGYSNDWSPIQDNLDASRPLADEIISQVILAEEDERDTELELYVITGSAGAGKTILLKRIAWDSGTEYEKLCLYWNSNERINYAAIIEIAEKASERIFLFVDKAASHVPDLMLMMEKLKRAKVKVTCIVSERKNEWNTECTPIQRYVSDDFDIRALGQKEINTLLGKLDEHSCLGVLQGKPREEQVKAFSHHAGRQLLVALHEVTLAKPFTEIIQDEYANIVPPKAQLIYRTICVMNRLSVPVRAGIINRIHGIDFKQFKEQFFSPLENVVKATDHTASFDHAYEARHPLIAEMVFQHALPEEKERLNVYLSIIASLDIGYSADRTAFRELIKYRSLASIFNDLNNINLIYDSAYKICGEDDFYFQQRAIFCMKSALKDYSQAESLLNQAERIGRHNQSIQHSLAELELLKADKSTGLERDKHYNRAKQLASTYTGVNTETSHGFDTLIKVELAQLKDAIALEDEELITESTNKAETCLRQALQTFPDDDVILSNEASLARMLNDSERVYEAIKKAFQINPSNSYLASSLCNIYLKRNNVAAAKETLEAVLAITPADKLAHGQLAMLFIDYEPDNLESAEYHFRRSFTDGDTNHLNQLYYARQLYIMGKFDEYLELTGKLKKLRKSPHSKHKVRGVLKDKRKQTVKLVGKVTRKEHSYAFLVTPGYQSRHFLHKSNANKEKWDSLKAGDDICYELGFTFSGAAAIQR